MQNSPNPHQTQTISSNTSSHNSNNNNKQASRYSIMNSLRGFVKKRVTGSKGAMPSKNAANGQNALKISSNMDAPQQDASSAANTASNTPFTPFTPYTPYTPFASHASLGASGKETPSVTLESIAQLSGGLTSNPSNANTPYPPDRAGSTKYADAMNNSSNKGMEAFTSESNKNPLLATLRARVMSSKDTIEWEHPCLRIYAMYELRGAIFGSKDYLYIVQGESVGRRDAKRGLSHQPRQLQKKVPRSVDKIRREEIAPRVSDYPVMAANTRGIASEASGALETSGKTRNGKKGKYRDLGGFGAIANVLDAAGDDGSIAAAAIEHYKIRWRDIVNVYKRHYIHQPMGLELFCRHSLQFFLVLHHDARQSVFETILEKARLKHSFSLHFQESCMKHSICVHDVVSGGTGLHHDDTQKLKKYSDGSDAPAGRQRLCACLGYNHVYSQQQHQQHYSSLRRKQHNLSSYAQYASYGTGAERKERKYSKIKSKLSVGGKKRKSRMGGNKFEESTALHCAQSLWMQGLLSNFDYIMFLNHVAGRSFNDVTQYPVFPWVVADFDSKELDYNASEVYRDLTRPMGALDPLRAGKYLEQFNEWEGRLSVGSQSGHYDVNTLFPYHYGTHYSNPASVFHYLLRMHPYTQSHCELQNGKFDHPDRLFHDLKETWTHQSKKSLHAVRELIPEFYYLASFLKNGANHAFGSRESDGVKIDNVILPEWAYGDENVFVEKHRRALESPFVSKFLHSWIDLIFGYKQQGPEAVKAQNVFHPLTYRNNFKMDKFVDSVMKQAAIEQVRSFGQTPIQLFDRPHPNKEIVYGSYATPSVVSSNSADAVDATLIQRRYPFTEVIFHCHDKVYQLSVSKHNGLQFQTFDVKSKSQTHLMDLHVSVNSMHNVYHRHGGNLISAEIGHIWCSSARNSEEYVPLLGSRLLTRLPLMDVVLKWGLQDGSLRVEPVLEGNGKNVQRCGNMLQQANRINSSRIGPLLENLHNDVITCVAVTQSGEMMVTGTRDGQISLWQIDFINTKQVEQELIEKDEKRQMHLTQNQKTHSGAKDANEANVLFEEGWDEEQQKFQTAPTVVLTPRLSMRLELISTVSAFMKSIECIVVSSELNLMITVCDTKAIVWDVTKLKIIHLMCFKDKIGGAAIANNRIIISHGENFVVYSIYGSKVCDFEVTHPFAETEDERGHSKNYSNFGLKMVNIGEIDHNHYEPAQDISTRPNDHFITSLFVPDQRGFILPPTRVSTLIPASELAKDPDMSNADKTDALDAAAAQVAEADMIKEEQFYTCFYMFTGHQDGTIRVWSLIHYGNDSHTHKNQTYDIIRVSKLCGHTCAVTSINLTGNGNILLSGDCSGKVIKWGLSQESLRAFHKLQFNSFQENARSSDASDASEASQTSASNASKRSNPVTPAPQEIKDLSSMTSRSSAQLLLEKQTTQRNLLPGAVVSFHPSPVKVKKSLKTTKNSDLPDATHAMDAIDAMDPNEASVSAHTNATDGREAALSTVREPSKSVTITASENYDYDDSRPRSATARHSTSSTSNNINNNNIVSALSGSGKKFKSSERRVSFPTLSEGTKSGISSVARHSAQQTPSGQAGNPALWAQPSVSMFADMDTDDIMHIRESRWDVDPDAVEYAKRLSLGDELSHLSQLSDMSHRGSIAMHSDVGMFENENENESANEKNEEKLDQIDGIEGKIATDSKDGTEAKKDEMRAEDEANDVKEVNGVLVPIDEELGQLDGVNVADVKNRVEAVGKVKMQALQSMESMQSVSLSESPNKTEISTPQRNSIAVPRNVNVANEKVASEEKRDVADEGDIGNIANIGKEARKLTSGASGATSVSDFERERENSLECENNKTYGDNEKGVTAIQRRSLKDEIKSKYEAFQVNFHYVCHLQHKLKQLTNESYHSNENVNESESKIEFIKKELMSSLELLRRSKHELEEAKALRPRIFCKFDIKLVLFCMHFDVGTKLTIDDTLQFKLLVDNNFESKRRRQFEFANIKDKINLNRSVSNNSNSSSGDSSSLAKFTIAAFDNFGQRVGQVSEDHKIAMIILMREGVHFEGLVESIDDFNIFVKVTGYTWIGKQLLVDKLKSIGVDLYSKTRVSIAP